MCAYMIMKALRVREAFGAFSEFDPLLRATHAFVRDHQSKIVYWSPGAQDLYGYSAEEAEGHVSHELLRTIYPRSLESIEVSIYANREWHGPLLHTTKTGEVKMVASHWTLYPEGDRWYIVEVNNEITAIRDLNEKLSSALREAEAAQRDAERAIKRAQEAQQEAERAAVARDEWLSLVSHELRSPLNVIRISATTLRGQTECTTKTLDRIDSAVQTLTRMIDDLIDSTRVSSGQFSLDRRRFALLPLLRDVLDSARLAAEAKQISLVSDLELGDIQIEGDQQRLHQALDNLFGNAIKFTAAGGRLKLSVRIVAEAIEVRISDTGEGIDPQLLPHIFKKFRKGNEYIGRKGGLGLGLWIAKNIVELHGGTIKACSEGTGRGATFTVVLPMFAHA